VAAPRYLLNLTPLKRVLPMSKIADFKKRHLQATGKQAEKVAKAVENSPAENLALRLLAQLLNVSEETAIETAQQYVDRNINFFAADLADGKDVSVKVELKANANGDITKISEVEEIGDVTRDIENSADNVNDAATTVEHAADNVNEAATSVDNAASDLAYTADDINAATEVLKEATQEIKKPSAAPKSSNSKKTEKQKNS
jgi:methyl-accepting chemotaxis protein